MMKETLKVLSFQTAMVMQNERENTIRQNGSMFRIFIRTIDIFWERWGIYDEEQFLDLLRRTQELEKQKNTLYGVVLIVMGIAMQALSYAVGGSDMKDFISGVLLGMSIAVMLIGVYVVGKSLSGK